MIPALTIILGFQLLGEVISESLGWALPGPVVGLVLLVLACWLRPALADRLRSVAQGLLGHLSLFFVPAGVGVIAHFGTVAEHGLAIGVALAVSTILAIAAGAWAFVAVARLSGQSADE